MLHKQKKKENGGAHVALHDPSGKQMLVMEVGEEEYSQG